MKERTWHVVWSRTAASLASGITMLGCGLVVHASSYSTTECAVNADCLAAHGDYWVCRKSDKSCVSLKSAECQNVVGNYGDDDAVIVGALLALSGTNQSTGIPEANAMQLALNDFTTAANGLPPVPGSSKRRPLALLFCDDAAAVDVGTRATRHMVNDVEVATIIGPTWSGVTIKLITDVTVPAGTLMIGTGTTSPDITGLQKNGLYYRTIESMVQETAAMAVLASDVEAQVRQTLSLAATDSIKMTSIFKGDSYGKGSTAVMITKLNVNGKSVTDPANQAFFKQIDYGDSGNPTADPLKYTDTVAAILQQLPHIIVDIGTTEVFANIIGPVEQQWPASAPYKPYWIFTHNQFVTASTDFLKTSDPSGDIRKRFIGTTAGWENVTYDTFRINYATQFSNKDNTSADSFAASNSYDAFYVAAYAIAALNGAPMTGHNIAGAIKNLVPPGQKITVGSNDLNTALGLLTSGQTIDLDGVSGPLDFDLSTGDVLQETQVWCIPAAGAGPGAPKFSGYHFDLTVKPVGTFDMVKAACGPQQ